MSRYNRPQPGHTIGSLSGFVAELRTALADQGMAIVPTDELPAVLREKYSIEPDEHGAHRSTGAVVLPYAEGDPRNAVVREVSHALGDVVITNEAADL